MKVEVTVPTEFQGAVIGLLNKRKGSLLDQAAGEQQVTLEAEVALSQMFGFSSDLRASTQGKGEFTMEYKDHALVQPDIQKKLVAAYEKARLAKEGKK